MSPAPVIDYRVPLVTLSVVTHLCGSWAHEGSLGPEVYRGRHVRRRSHEFSTSSACGNSARVAGVRSAGRSVCPSVRCVLRVFAPSPSRARGEGRPHGRPSVHSPTAARALLPPPFSAIWAWAYNTRLGGRGLEEPGGKLRPRPVLCHPLQPDGVLPS